MEYSHMPIPSPDQGIHVQEHRFYIGVDLGQANDYTAICVLERIVTGRGVIGHNKNGEYTYRLRHLERPPRGTEYTDVVDRLIELYKSPQLGEHERAVVIDFTGLGRPVYDMMKQAGFRYSLNAISITAGADPTYNDGHFNVPKRDLVSNLQILLQRGVLKIAKGMKETDALIDELTNFQTKISAAGHDTYGARSGAHDDLVLSVSMAAWLACKGHVRVGGAKWM